LKQNINKINKLVRLQQFWAELGPWFTGGDGPVLGLLVDKDVFCHFIRLLILRMFVLFLIIYLFLSSGYLYL